MPDTPVNETIPFYTEDTPTKNCGNMANGDYCSLQWTINATGDIDSSYNMDVLFESESTQFNDTGDTKIIIFSCSIDFTLQWSSISFGSQNPNTYEISAPGNANRIYNITTGADSCNTDFYIKGIDLENASSGYYIGVGNITWSNISNAYSGSVNLTTTNALIMANVSKNTNVTTWYWLNVPPVYAYKYNGTITISGVEYESPAP